MMNPHPSQSLPNLQTTLSSLNDLVSLSNRILPFSPPPPTLTTNLIQCPFTPHHLLPPSSLFLHHLRCPSSPRPLPNLDHILHSLSYPKTLHNPHSLQLSSYFDFSSNFFYRNCPGVVTFSDAHSTAKTATFTLPTFLSLECEDTKISESVCTRPILPSEYFSIARELESWNHYPSSYSNAVLRAISGLAIAKERDLATWIITNSPRYGVVIDTPMQHHIFLLCCLCFKSILREASVSVSVSMEKHLGCPVLSQALAWLESQVSILFGANGKSFVLNFVKHCILVGASVLLLFPLGDGEVTEPAASSSKQESQNSDTNGVDIIKDATPAAQREEKNNTDCIRDRKISVPQVVAAVAALHERSLLERQIKGFWFSQPSSNYQMVSEHCYLSEKANEERKKRYDYRPIIDYDWFHRQQSSNQETHKEKSREELLAEERDYKRRRMSYRGKKANQSTVQVMRDLIEEYMEEIKLAGGVRSPVKVSEDSEMFPSNLPSGLDIPMAMEANNSGKVSHDSPAVTISNPSYHEQQSRTNYSDKSKAVHDVFSRDYDQHKQGHRRSHYYGEDQQTADQGNHRSHASTSPERHRSHSRSHERRIDHKKQDYSNRKKYNNSSRTRDRWQNDTHRNHISDSFLNNAFSDRYDPSESRKNWEDDISSDDKYVKPDKFSDKELN